MIFNLIKKEEVPLFQEKVNEINSSTALLFCPVLCLFLAKEFVTDLTKFLSPNPQYADKILHIQWLVDWMNFAPNVYGVFALLDFIIICSMTLVIILDILFRKHPEKFATAFFKSIGFNSICLLLCAAISVIVDACVIKVVDYNFFLLTGFLMGCVFYVNYKVFIYEDLVLFAFMEVLFQTGLIEVTSRSYFPYIVIFELTLCLIAAFRASVLLGSLRREVEIERLQQIADNENKLKSMFLANMSHEIRTPMNAIVGMSEIAQGFKLDDAEKNTIRQIQSAGISLVSIINDILDFSKIESGKLDIVPVEFDLFKMIYDVANVSLVKIKKNVKLIIEFDSKIPCKIVGDDIRIRQVLINLLGNAAKFTDKGSITIRVKKTETEDGEAILFNVMDTGVGIRIEDQKTIFEAFRQVDMKMNRTKGGTGLGLAISRNLVQLMGGQMGISSKYGEGSDFNFYIPFVLPEETTDVICCEEVYKRIFQESQQIDDSSLFRIPIDVLNKSENTPLFVEKLKSIAFSASKAKVLVVDDNEVNLEVASGLLKKFSVKPVLVSSGYDALDRIKESDFDIIFMDHQMPGMDGVETLKKIRETEKNKNIVIALSANAVNGAREMFIKSGFDDFVSKPVQGKDFAKVLQQYLKPELICPIDEDSQSDDDEDSEQEKRLKKIFAKTIAENSASIRDCLKNKDIKNFTIKVHALKNAARVVGADRLSSLAETLEKLGNQYDQNGDVIIEIESITAEMIPLYESYIEKFAEYLDSPGEESKKESCDEAKLQGLIKDIVKACQQNDLNELDPLVEQLKKYSLPEPLASNLDKIVEAAENIDFDTILGILE